MLPPLPPSPPLGPPRGTYFSRRNATQPLPPSPAFTKIFASSTNTAGELQTLEYRSFRSAGNCCRTDQRANFVQFLTLVGFRIRACEHRTDGFEQLLRFAKVMPA